MGGLTTLAPEPTFVNTGSHTVRCRPFPSSGPVPATDVSFLGGPHPQRGAGAVAPFDFALDRESLEEYLAEAGITGRRRNRGYR